MSVKTLRPFIEDQMRRSPDASKTVGDLAREKLKKAARRDFGKDAPQWRAWVTAHVQEQ
jgi:hypothetical protein